MRSLIVSYYTPAYRQDALGLVESLDALGIGDVVVTELEDRGSWELNCAYKPTFIREMMVMFDRPIVWLDSDARVVAQPTLFDSLTCDMAAHYRHGVELLSGTLFFNNTSRATDLLVAWEKACAANPGEWDQRVLQRIVDAGGWNVERLPSEYVRIFDDPKMGEPVILHTQASRRLKHCASPS